MGELPDAWRELLRDFFYTSMIDGDFRRIARGFKRVGAVPEDAGTDEEVAERLAMAVAPMLDLGVGSVSLAEVFKGIVATAEGLGVQSPQELVLLIKQLLYFERYARELAPGWALARDLYLVKNVFPQAVAAKAAAEGIALPD